MFSMRQTQLRQAKTLLHTNAMSAVSCALIPDNTEFWYGIKDGTTLRC